VFRIGAQPVNATLQAYYNVEKPRFGPDWSLRFVISFLFPK
jgi:DNA-binding XRE family transcriptional regulator